MSAESDFYSLLSGNAGVTAIIGAGANARIYPDALPEDLAYPAIIFIRVRTDPILLIHGGSAGDDIELSVQCWSTTRTSADATADAVEAALIGSPFVRISRDGASDEETGLLVTLLGITTFR